MNYLWTPWRMQYISGPQSEEASAGIDGEPEQMSEQIGIDDHLLELTADDCVFCDRIRLPRTRDRESLILLRADNNFVILNLYPYNSAHLMIVPYRHTADFTSLAPETLHEMMALAQRLVAAIGAEYRPQGYNMGMNMGEAAGAGVAHHLHLHIVPRWAGDTNFMPIVGATKVLPELLETTYDRLKARLRSTE